MSVGTREKRRNLEELFQGRQPMPTNTDSRMFIKQEQPNHA